jgi:hypothetical protein
LNEEDLKPIFEEIYKEFNKLYNIGEYKWS